MDFWEYLFCVPVSGRDPGGVSRGGKIEFFIFSSCQKLWKRWYTLAHTPPSSCPVCGTSGSLACAEHLGSDGFFYVCSGPCGCGTSFIVTHAGECEDFF
jgi:hypothetical protein